ncbi:MAG: hypothetical protein ACT4OP_08600 [Actinomycetota bacterium]
MVKVYAVVLALGVIALITWIFAAAFASNAHQEHLDPETRFGVKGRRVVAGLVGFGMAGMSAEFSPRGITWPWALVLALLGAGAAAWYAGWIDRSRAPGPPEKAAGDT